MAKEKPDLDDLLAFRYALERPERSAGRLLRNVVREDTRVAGKNLSVHLETLPRGYEPRRLNMSMGRNLTLSVMRRDPVKKFKSLYGKKVNLKLNILHCLNCISN